MEKVPIWEKYTLTVEEACAYTNIGENRIRQLINNPTCKFVLHAGNKNLIKRKEFEKYMQNIENI